jgi:hypothetical protein
MHVMVPRACISDMPVLLFDWVVSGRIWLLGANAFQSNFTCDCVNEVVLLNSRPMEAYLYRCQSTSAHGCLVTNDVMLEVDEDLTWMLWFIQLYQIFVVVTYVTEIPCVCLNSFMLTLLFYYYRTHLCYSLGARYIHIVHH